MNKKTKRLFSLLLALVMVLTAIPITAMPVSAAPTPLTPYRKGVYLSKKAYQWDSPRVNDTKINVVTDIQGSENQGKLSVGYWIYNLTTIPENSIIDSATLTVPSISYENINVTDVNNYVKFFPIPASFLQSDDILKSIFATNNLQYRTDDGSHTEKFMNSSTSGDYNRAYDGFLSAYNLTDSDALLSVQRLTTKPAPQTITNAVSQAIARGDDYFIIAAVHTKCATDSYWSDTNINHPTISVEHHQSNFTNDSILNTTTGRVTIDNALFTSASGVNNNYGTYTTTNTDFSTPVTIKSGNYTLSNITVVETGNTIRTDANTGSTRISSGQNLGSGHNFEVHSSDANANKEVYATLKFNFSDEKSEYHKVAVKTLPAEVHLSVSLQNKWTNNKGYETSFETRFNKSFGSLPTTVSYRDTNSLSDEDYNYGVWEHLGWSGSAGSSTNGDYYPQKHMFNYDKKAGYAAFYAGNNITYSDANSPIAEYYIDKSSKTLANGACWTGSEYKIPIQNTKWDRYTVTEDYTNVLFYSDYNIKSGNLDSIGTSPSTAKVVAMPNKGDTHTIYYHNNKSITNTDDVRVSFKIEQQGQSFHMEQKAKLIVNLFDKGTTRTAYDNAVKTVVEESACTATAYKNYLDALFNAEGYLSNYEITTTEGDTTTYQTAINNAKAELDKDTGKRGNVTNIITAANEAYNKLYGADHKNYTASTKKALEDVLADLTYVDQNGSTFTSSYTGDAREFSLAMEKADVDRIKAKSDALIEAADFQPLDDAYNNAVNILTQLSTEDAEYTEESVQNLVDVLNGDAKVYYTFAENQRVETPVSPAQENMNTLINNINDAIKGLKPVDPKVADMSVYNAMNEKVDNYDKDVYILTDQDKTDINNALETDVVSTVTYVKTDSQSLNIKTFSNSLTQDNVDNAIKAAEERMNSNISSYTITASNASIPNVDIDSNTDGVQVAYGTWVTFTADGNNKDTAWYMNYDSTDTTRTKQYQAYGSTYSLNVFGNITVEAHSRTKDTPNKVTITKKYSGTSQNSGTELIDFVNGSYTLPVPSAVAGYAFQNYTVNGETKNAGDVLTITKDTSINANYQYDGSTYTVTIGGTAANHNYNDKVELNAAEGKVWLQKIADNNYRMFYNGPTTTLFVVGNIELISVEIADLGKYNISEKPIYLLNQGTMVAEHKLVFNGQVVQPEGKTVKEYGVLIGRPKTGGQITAEDVKVENAGDKTNYKILRAKSTKSYGADQFTIRVGGLENSTGVIYKGYVILEDNATKQITTVYTDAEYYN